MDNDLSASTARLNIHGSTPQTATVPICPVTHSVKFPAIKLEPFAGNVETWYRFWEQFRSSIDEDASLLTINKHVFLRGYLEGEPKMLVDGIAVTGNAYGETKKILLSRYGDTNSIIQAHGIFSRAYLRQNLPRQTNWTPLSSSVIAASKLIGLWGENVNVYGRVLVPKILRAFPPEFCQRWIVHVKRQVLSEGDILELTEFLVEEVDGALTAQKIRAETLDHPNYIPSVAALHVNYKQSKSGRKDRHTGDYFCVFCESKVHWAQECKKVTEVSARRQKLKSAHRCFLCLIRDHNTRICSKRVRALFKRCKGAHHRSICSETGVVTTPTKKTAHTTVGKLAVASPGESTRSRFVFGRRQTVKLRR